MAKKIKDKETTIQDYYDLKVDKVDELVAALKDENVEFDTPVDYSINASMGITDPANVKRNGKDKQFDPYHTDFLGKIPTWLKAIFIKFWFAGAVCYFFMMGIMNNTDLDTIVLVGLALGIVTDILVNPLFRYLESDRREYDIYMMFPFPFKAFWTFFANIFYYIIVILGVYFMYLLLFTVTPAYGVEPLLFGVFTVVVDMIFIGIKDGVVALVRHLKTKHKENV